MTRPLRLGRATSPARGEGLRVRLRPSGQGGQALVETAITIPILFLLFLGFLAVGVVAQAYVDLNTAVHLAAASAATAPANDPADGTAYAQETFNVTLSHFPLLQPVSPNEPSCQSGWGPTGDPPQPWPVTCSGTARLMLSQTALALIVPGDPRISATATAYGSPYRSTK